MTRSPADFDSLTAYYQWRSEHLHRKAQQSALYAWTFAVVSCLACLATGIFLADNTWQRVFNITAAVIEAGVALTFLLMWRERRARRRD